MGLLNLSQKIEKVFKRNNFSEEEVVYLLIEIGKYIERSGKNLDQTITEKLDKNDLSTIKFFRNWIAHPSIDNPVPEHILFIFTNILEKDKKEAEEELFSLLKEEMSMFCDIARINTDKDKINWSSFFEGLKHILSEQPVKIMGKHKYVFMGFDELLILKKF